MHADEGGIGYTNVYPSSVSYATSALHDLGGRNVIMQLNVQNEWYKDTSRASPGGRARRGADAVNADAEGE